MRASVPAVLLVFVAFATACRDPGRVDTPASSTPLPMPPSGSPTTVSTAPPPPSSSVPSSGSTSFPGAADIPWDGDPGAPKSLDVVGKDDVVEVEIDKDQRRSAVQRVRFHRQAVWQHPLPEQGVAEAAVLVDVAAGRVYVAHYSAIASGATIYSLDLTTGAQQWATPAHGLGPVSHSKYFNHVTLRRVGGAIVAFGNEAQGRYVEVFHPTTGQMTSTRVVPSGGK